MDAAADLRRPARHVARRVATPRPTRPIAVSLVMEQSEREFRTKIDDPSFANFSGYPASPGQPHLEAAIAAAAEALSALRR